MRDETWVLVYVPDAPEAIIEVCSSYEAALQRALPRMVATFDTMVAWGRRDEVLSIGALINEGRYIEALDAWNAVANDHGHRLDVIHHDRVHHAYRRPDGLDLRRWMEPPT